jgi:hypothetical protein
MSFGRGQLDMLHGDEKLINSGSDFGMKLTNPASKRPDLIASNCSRLADG